MMTRTAIFLGVFIALVWGFDSFVITAFATEDDGYARLSPGDKAILAVAWFPTDCVMGLERAMDDSGGWADFLAKLILNSVFWAFSLVFLWQLAGRKPQCLKWCLRVLVAALVLLPLIGLVQILSQSSTESASFTIFLGVTFMLGVGAVLTGCFKSASRSQPKVRTDETIL